MYFSNPTYLWALLGILVPLAIHLWSRRDARTIKVGSIALLEASDAVRSRSLYPSEWVLLLLRMLIIALLALLLAGPQLSPKKGSVRMVYVAEASLVEEGLLNGILDSLENGAELRILQMGLPKWDPDAYVSEVPDYWQLVPELNALQADSIVVFARAYAKGLKSSRPETASHIHWLAVTGETQRELPLWAYGDNEKVWLFNLRTGPDRSSLERVRLESSSGAYRIDEQGDSLRLGEGENTRAVPFQKATPLLVHLFAEESLESDRQYMEAALSAVSRYLDLPVEVLTGMPGKGLDNFSQNTSNGTSTDRNPDLTIWLSPRPVPEGLGRTLIWAEDPLSAHLIEPGPTADMYHLTQRLNAENSVSERLTENLIPLLLPMKDANEELLRADIRQVEATFLSVPGSQTESNVAPEERNDNKKKKRSKDPGEEDSDDAPLWILLLLLLSAERLLALKRNQ